jgi:hypothetical protein
MAKYRLVLAVLVSTTAGIVTLAGSQAQAHDPGAGSAPAGAVAAAPGAPVFLAADLRGRNEVPAADPDGRAAVVVRIQGNQVAFALAWRGIAPPTAAHIHVGAAGVNGAVRVGFFAGALPATVSAVTGSVTVADQAVLDAIVADPAGFYANIHTAEFPGGAVRGQLRQLKNPVDLQRFLTVGSLVSVMSGDQEVAGGDADGHGVGFVRAHSGRVDFGLTWSGIAPPMAGHIHQGAVGVNGPVVVPFFAAPAGLPASINGIAGTVTGVAPELVAAINRNPRGYYTNLHNVEFPGGAIRGQLFRPRAGFDDDALSVD